MKVEMVRGRFAVGMAAFVSAPAAGRAADESSYVLRLNIPTAPNSLFVTSGLQLAVNVLRRSKGRLKIDVYPSGQLAREQESVDALTTGVLDLTMQTTTFLISLVQDFQILDMPFLFKDLSEGYRMLDGPIGQELFKRLEPKGILGLMWGSSGFKQIETTSKTISNPEDMKGLRIRIQPGPVYVATYQALGANPVVVDFAETFTALQQRTIDGIDVSLDAFTTAKLYTVAKRMAMLNSFFTVFPLLASKRKLDALPADLQKILREEAKGITLSSRALLEQRVADQMQTCRDNGVTFSEVNHQAFRKAMDPVYATYRSRPGGDLLARIIRG